MVQFILVWVSKPRVFKVISLEAELAKMLYKQQALHIDNIILYSLLMDEVSQCGRDVKVLESLLLHLFVGEIYNFGKSQLNGNRKKQTVDYDLKVPILHDGRALIALGLIKILGIKGVLVLSTFSLNFSCGLATFLA